MNGVILTQYDGAILGPIAKVLGFLLNGIFIVIDFIGIPNVALAIILFTIVIYMVMLPLTIKQQKFSKLSAKMNPELQAIQAKYKGKKDQDSMTRMNEETQAVYKKYGVSPTGSCVYMLIQMPILFALYRVIYNVPAYVTKVKEAFIPLVDEMIKSPGAFSFISNKDNFSVVNQFSSQFNYDAFKTALDSGLSSLSDIDVNVVKNVFVDVLNRASTVEWANIYSSANYPNLENLVKGTVSVIEKYNNFLGLNIANSPQYYIIDAFKNKGSIGLAFVAILIPIFSAITQWLNTKLMPQQDMNNGNDQANAMAASMKSMNIMMPLMSMVFCFSLPIGMGLYWIAGAVIRGVQQVFVNKHIDKMNLDEIIAKNTEKMKAEIEKKGVKGDIIKKNSSLSTKAMADKRTGMSDKEREEFLKKSNEYYNKGFKEGSLASKANMVKQYNEKNNK